jgi:hypothetical protein
MIDRREYLYRLLPRLYHLRDRAQGEPLRALLSVLDAEFQLLWDDLDGLYDNWFIETCDEWVVPYIGDLLGIQGILPLQGSRYSQRALVANTLAYRRGKGTAAVLEQLARDATGWPARVVEFFDRLSLSQHTNHIRPYNVTTVDLRDSNQLERIHTPFEIATHTADVRSIAQGRGLYNIPNVGIFLWRLQSYFLTWGLACPSGVTGCYSINPLGLSVPLFNRPRTEVAIAQLADEVNVSLPLRRIPPDRELRSIRQGQDSAVQRSYFNQQPVFEVRVEGFEIPLQQIFIANLTSPSAATPQDWYRPLPRHTGQSDAEASAVPAAIRNLRVGVDPVLGRLVLSRVTETAVEPHSARVEISYAYGFSGDLGGGPYERTESIEDWFTPLPGTTIWQIAVSQSTDEQTATPSQVVTTLQSAITQWNAAVTARPAPLFGVIVLLDNGSYDLSSDPAPTILLPAQTQLAIVAARWPAIDNPAIPGQKIRLPLSPDQPSAGGRLLLEGRRPHLRGNLSVAGRGASDRPLNPADNALILDGLLIEGTLTVAPGNLGRLHLAHTTLVPTEGGLTVAASAIAPDASEAEIEIAKAEQNAHLNLLLRRTITGPIALEAAVPTLTLIDTIVDNGSGGLIAGSAITAPATAATVYTSTLLGSTEAQTLEASNSIFLQSVQVSRRQTGCVRFSYVPASSLVPRRFRCQPDDSTTDGEIAPYFTTLDYGEPGYAQFAVTTPNAITAGAEDEGEMGAFHFLQQPQRLRNLQIRLHEYLRFGLDAGIFLLS